MMRSLVFGLLVCGFGCGSSEVSGKRVFITSATFLGLAVESACSDSAAAGGLGGSWVPWLSTMSADAIDRVGAAGPWRLLNGQEAFTNHSALGTQPLVPIDVTENGQRVSSSTEMVWTGTNTGGRGSGMNCDGWTSGSSSSIGTQGNTMVGTWTFSGDTACDGQAHVYCFEL